MNVETGTYMRSEDRGKPRLFLRHPADVPIIVAPAEGRPPCGQDCKECLRDAGLGGLCFQSEMPYEVGANIDITIPIARPPFKERCRVVWCRPTDGCFEIGVSFCERGKDHTARMVEQVCHIEHYRRQVREQEGRELSAQEAALEWIGKYAEGFPRP